MIRKTFLILALWFLVPPAHSLWSASRRAVDTYDLEAAYLVHFLEFVDWPSDVFADEKAPYVIGIVGEDPFGDTLDHLIMTRRFNGRTVIIRRFGGFDPTDLDSIGSCHILFVSASEKARLAAILKGVRKAPVLTVSEIDKFPLYGGMVWFDQEGKKIRLVLNPKAAKSAKLQVRARLLQVCRVFQEE